MKDKTARELKRAGNRRGASLMELMMVLAVIAVLAMMAAPAILSILPYNRVRAEAKHVATVTRQVRLKAASTQKPIRVVLDCTSHLADTREPCVLTQQAAIYKDGQLDGWQSLAGSRHEMSRRVAVLLPGSAAGHDGEATVDGISWIIFMPSSRVFSNPRPFELLFVSEEFNRNRTRAAWLLSVNAATGRTTLTKP